MTRPLVLACAQMSDPPFRRVLIKSLLLTGAVYALFGLAASYGLGTLPEEGWGWIPWDWLAVAIKWLAAGAVIFLLIVLFPAVATLFVSFFLDEIAVAVERRHYAHDPPGEDTSLGPSMLLALRYTGVLIALNIAVVPLYALTFWLPFVGVFIFCGLNGYLLGREYFELVAQRHSPPIEMRKLRKTYRNSIVWRGVFITIMLMVPGVNFVVPVLATAWMVHVFKDLDRKMTSESAVVS
jgi:CysZ protein